MAPASTCLEPQVLLVILTFSEHPWVHGTRLALEPELELELELELPEFKLDPELDLP